MEREGDWFGVKVATEFPSLFIVLHAEAKLPESRPATADEPTLVHLKSQLLDLHKKGIGFFL